MIGRTSNPKLWGDFFTECRAFGIGESSILERTVIRDDKGRIVKWISMVYERPIENRKTHFRKIRMWQIHFLVIPDLENPDTGNPDTVNPDVALSDKDVKFANLVWWGNIPDTIEPYYKNPPYTANVYYEPTNKAVLDVLVREVGPWNENDNYWDAADDVNP